MNDAIDLILRSGLATQEHIDDAHLVKRDLPGTMWSILMDMGQFTDDEFRELMIKDKSIATIDLANYNVPKDILSLLPENLVRQRFVIPVDKLGKLLTLAMVCPQDQSVMREAESITGLRTKTMLCTYDGIKKVIQTTFKFSPVESNDSNTRGLVQEFNKHLNEKIVVRRIFRIDDLYPTQYELQQLKDIPEDDATTLTRLLSDNPILLGHALRLGNSDAYGFPGKVDAAGMAVALAGQIALKNNMNDIEGVDYKKKYKTFDIAYFFKRSRFCAIAAETLARHIGFSTPSTAYTVGLLFEIGRLIMLECLPNGYAISTQDIIGRELYEREQYLYQFTYTEAGYYILRKWNLPTTILEPIRYQLKPAGAKQTKELPHILCLAISLTKAFINNSQPEFDERDEASLNSLKISSKDAMQLYNEASTTFQNKMQASQI
jgi:HD-like signal output (HDOD) protein